MTDRIRNATSVANIRELLAEGESYETASEQTKKKWHRVAKQVIADNQLQ